jgi:hypothetical protein
MSRFSAVPDGAEAYLTNLKGYYCPGQQLLWGKFENLKNSDYNSANAQSQLGVSLFRNFPITVYQALDYSIMSTEFQSETPIPEAEQTTSTQANHTEETSTTSVLGSEASQQVQQVWDKVSGLLGNLPDYVSDFFKEYRRPIVTIGLIFAAFISVKLVLALLGAINEVPLLAPTFELIGLIYSGWFLYRYLLKASNRQELFEDINSLKDQVLGKNA